MDIFLQNTVFFQWNLLRFDFLKKCFLNGFWDKCFCLQESHIQAVLQKKQESFHSHKQSVRVVLLF